MKDLANVRIYGDTDGAVYVGAFTATMPVALAVPDPEDFPEVGWCSEDGVDIINESDSTAFTAWQGGKVVRRRVTSNEDTFTFQALEENAVTMGLLLPGSTITTTTGVTKIVPADGIVADPRKFVLDFFDGTVQKRYNVINGEITERGTIPHKNTEMSIMEFTVSMLEYEIYSNNPALVVA